MARHTISASAIVILVVTITGVFTHSIPRTWIYAGFLLSAVLIYWHEKKSRA